MAKKFTQLYDEVLQEWTSDFMKHAAFKVGTLSGAAGGLIANAAMGSHPYATLGVSVAAAAAGLLGYGQVWLADRLVQRELSRKEAMLQLNKSIEKYKTSPLFSNQVKKKMKDPSFIMRMKKLKLKHGK